MTLQFSLWQAVRLPTDRSNSACLTTVPYTGKSSSSVRFQPINIWQLISTFKTHVTYYKVEVGSSFRSGLLNCVLFILMRLCKAPHWHRISRKILWSYCVRETLWCNEVQKYGCVKVWPYCDNAVKFRPRFVCQPNNLVTHVWKRRKHWTA